MSRCCSRPPSAPATEECLAPFHWLLVFELLNRSFSLPLSFDIKTTGSFLEEMKHCFGALTCLHVPVCLAENWLPSSGHCLTRGIWRRPSMTSAFQLHKYASHILWSPRTGPLLASRGFLVSFKIVLMIN